MTALIAVQRLQPGDGIPISPLAEGMPARKINVKAGQVWTFKDLLYSMMMVSANDAAVAIAEKLGGGSLDGYLRIADATADRLQLADQPVFNDPAGLDDEFANKGGARISPRDLAIVSRAVLARPDLVSVINTPHYEFTGGDGIGHTLNNHDLFLDLYPGANGLKTGTTDLAGHTFVGFCDARRPHDARRSSSTPPTTTARQARCSTKVSTRRSRPRRASTTCRRSSPTRRCLRRRRAGTTVPKACPGPERWRPLRRRRAAARRFSTRPWSRCSC